jgi:small-conductance mechanosensitive channel
VHLLAAQALYAAQAKAATVPAAPAAPAKVVAQPLTPWDWVIAGAVLVAGIVVGRVVRAVLSKAIRRGDSERGAAETIGRVAALLVTLAAFVYALVALGVRLGPFLGALGIGGVAIAFAAQAILANFLASIILQVRRPFRRGEQVTTNGLGGTVEEVNFRTVVLRTYDGERVYVPAAKVLNEPIVNHTRLGRRRTSLPIGLSYDTDLDAARRIALDAVRDLPELFVDPAPDVQVESFGDSAVNVVVRFWHAPDIGSLWRARTAVAMAVKRAFDEAGIAIPFPQVVLHGLREKDSSLP